MAIIIVSTTSNSINNNVCALGIKLRNKSSPYVTQNQTELSISSKILNSLLRTGNRVAKG